MLLIHFLFHTQSSTNEDNELYVYNSVLSEEKNIIEAIHELSTRSAEGPDGIPSSLLVNFATELAPLFLI